MIKVSARRGHLLIVVIYPQHISIGTKMAPLIDTPEIYYRVLGRNLRDEVSYPGSPKKKLRMIKLKLKKWN